MLPNERRGLRLGLLATIALLLWSPAAAVAVGDRVDVALHVTRVDLDSRQVELDVSLTWESPPAAGVGSVYLPFRCTNFAQIREPTNQSVLVLTGSSTHDSGTLVKVEWPASSQLARVVVEIARCVAPISDGGGASAGSAFVALAAPPTSLSRMSNIENLVVSGDAVSYSQPGGTSTDANTIRLDSNQRAGSGQVKVHVSGGDGGTALISAGLIVAFITFAYSYFQRSEPAFSRSKLIVASALVVLVLLTLTLGWRHWAFLREFGLVSVAAAGIGHAVAMIVVQVTILVQRYRDNLKVSYPAGDASVNAKTPPPPGDP